MKNKHTPKQQFHLILLLALLLVGMAVMLVYNNQTSATSINLDNTPHFLPFVIREPDPTPIPAIPQLVTTIPLEQVQCPNFVGVNETSGYVYVANNFSNDVSIFSGPHFVATVPTGGEWPTKIAVDPTSNRAFVTNLHVLDGSSPPTQLTMFRDASVVTTYDQFFEGHTPLYNSVNDYLYVTDLDSNIRVFDAQGEGLTYLTDIGQPQGIYGWITSATFDPETGLVYVASWDYGKVHVIEGTQVIATFDTQTWGPASLVLDREHGYLYVVGQEVDARPEGYPNYNVTVFNAHAPFQFLAGFTTASSSISVGWDPIGGYVYVSNPLDNSVSVFHGLQHVNTMPAGTYPRYLAVHPETGYAFVPSSVSNSITILKNGQIVDTIADQGIGPWAVGINSVTDYVYVANRGRELNFQCRDASVTILR